MDLVSTAGAREDTVSVSDLLVEFGGWLDRQRGLASATVHSYCWHARQFLAALPQPAQVSVSLLDAGTVTAFMVGYCRDCNTNSAKSMARSVRSFLRFAHATGRTSAELRGAVPSSSGWHLASLPRSVPAGDLERLLAVAARSRFTATGRRDYAILLLLARLGFTGITEGVPAQQALDALDEAGRIFWPKQADGMPRLKRYLEEAAGIPALDVITDIRPLHNNVGGERIGYPTQKPVALLERFITSPSDRGGVVLDPFCEMHTFMRRYASWRPTFPGIAGHAHGCFAVCSRSVAAGSSSKARLAESSRITEAVSEELAAGDQGIHDAIEGSSSSRIPGSLPVTPFGRKSHLRAVDDAQLNYYGHGQGTIAFGY